VFEEGGGGIPQRAVRVHLPSEKLVDVGVYEGAGLHSVSSRAGLQSRPVSFYSIRISPGERVDEVLRAIHYKMDVPQPSKT